MERGYHDVAGPGLMLHSTAMSEWVTNELMKASGLRRYLFHILFAAEPGNLLTLFPSQ